MPVKAGDLEIVAGIRDDATPALKGIQNAANAINLDRASEQLAEFGKRSSEVTKVKVAFESVAETAGLSDKKILESAKAATLGLLTEHDLRLNANKALSLGVVENEQDFANLAEAAIILGQKLGVDAGQADLASPAGVDMPELGFLLVGIGNVQGGMVLSVTRTQQALQDSANCRQLVDILHRR